MTYAEGAHYRKSNEEGANGRSSAFSKVEMRMKGTRKRNHRWRDINTDHRPPRSAAFAASVPGPSCNIEQSGAVSNMSSREQRLYRLSVTVENASW